MKVNDDIDEDLLDIEGLPERVDGELVGGHHDGGVGDLSDQLGAQTPGQSPPSLLLVHEPQRLPEGSVLASRFS